MSPGRSGTPGTGVSARHGVRASTLGWSLVRFCVRIAGGDIGEAPEVPVGGPDCADTVLAHQCRDVRVGDQVATDDVMVDGVFVNLPEPRAFPGAPYVRTVEQVPEIGSRNVRIEGFSKILGWVAIRR